MTKTKILKLIIAFIMIIIQSLLASTNVKAVNIGETKNLERGERGYYCVQKWDGSKWIFLTYNQTFYTDTDGQRYMAYCLSPGLPGVGYVSGEKESYSVKVNKLLDNDVIWRVLKNGYPNKSIDELGVETADDAYFATMQAINAILRGYTIEQARELYTPGQFAIEGANYEDVQRRGKKTLDTMFKLMDIGLNGTETREKFLQIAIQQKSDIMKENDDFYSITLKVNSSAEISEFYINQLKNLPNGSYVSDKNGKVKDKFSGSEEFKIMIPADKIKNDIAGKISIKAKQKNYPIYYGSSTIEGFQDFALCNNSYSEVDTSTEISVKTNVSKLVINKIDKDTKKPISNVKFQITLSDGTIKNYTTDANGRIVIDNQKPGKIIVKELEAVDKYKLNTDEMEIELKYNESKEITVENELQRGNIKVIKIDKDNNKIRLEGVKFELRDENNTLIQEGETDKKGELLFGNILVGKYKIIETQTKAEYELLNEELIIEVENDKTKELQIENVKTSIPEEPEKPQKPEKPQEPEKPQKPVEEPKLEVKKELPKTGDNNNLYLTIVYVFIIGASGIWFLCKTIKKYRKKSK